MVFLFCTIEGRSLYAVNGKLNDRFPISVGVRQGCVMMTLGCLMCIHEWNDERAQGKSTGVEKGYIYRAGGRWRSAWKLMYADDAVLLLPLLTMCGN